MASAILAQAYGYVPVAYMRWWGYYPPAYYDNKLQGVLTEHLLSSLISSCKQANIPVIVDPKGYTYSRYCGATVVTPNLAEANLARGNEAGH